MQNSATGYTKNPSVKTRGVDMSASQPSPAQKEEHTNTTITNYLPPYSVILHNDLVHSMDYVVTSLLKSISTIGLDEAKSIMIEAHNEGRAVVITCPLEHAELYSERIRTFGLSSTLEKA